MKTAAVIAEYNPFHNGHCYQFRQIQEETGVDYIIAIMSPDFVQRGEPAIFDKYVRTQAALLCGADLVLELPVTFATGSAETFARGAVCILSALGVVDELCFGCEEPDSTLLQTISEILAQEPPTFRNRLQKHLSAGLSWPQAREEALLDLVAGKSASVSGIAGCTVSSQMSVNPETAATGNNLTNVDDIGADPDRTILMKMEGTVQAEALSAFLKKPNNILALEYYKAIRQLNSPIHPHPLQRTGSDYNSTVLPAAFTGRQQETFSVSGFTRTVPCSADISRGSAGVLHCSAGALRTALKSGMGWAQLSPYIPEQLQDFCKNEMIYPVFPDDLTPYFIYSLLSAENDEKSAAQDPDPEVLSRRMKRLRYTCIGKSWEETAALLKTRQITASAVRRCMLRRILRTPSQVSPIFQANPYVRILGFRKSSAPLLHAIKKNSRGSVLTKNADAKNALQSWPELTELLDTDIRASHLYQAVLSEKYGINFRPEFERSPVILDY